MRFLKVFLSAVFLFAYFNSYAQPITGAFGYKLGQHIPSWEEGRRVSTKVNNIKDEFFDRIMIKALPESKKLYSILAIKKVVTCGKSKGEVDALTQLLRDKYPSGSEFNNPNSVKRFNYVNNRKEISLTCGSSYIRLHYIDLELKNKYIDELQSIRQKKKEAAKVKIDASQL